MVQIAELILFIVWMPQAVYQLLVWLYWWQDKEYRIDRFVDFLGTEDSVRKLLIWPLSLKLITLIIFTTLGKGLYVLLLVYIFFDFNFLNIVLNEGLRRPIFTQRAIRIFVTCFVVSLFPFVLYFSDFWNLSFSLITAEVLLVASINVGIFWTGFVTRRVKNKEKQLAINLITKHKPYVIGVTGSYGKTTTKEFIFQLIGGEGNTIKTEGNQNTDFGIIRKVNSGLKPGIKYFVCEMGAYKKGEIKQSADIVKPSLAVITGIEEQHLSLFGSLENILNAKFELVESLPENGIAVFNLGNDYCRKLFEKASQLKTKLRVYGYASFDKGNRNDIEHIMYFKKISESEKGLAFKVYWQGKEIKLFAPVYGEHFLENITGALLTAKLLGMKWDKIQTKLNSVITPPGTMRVHRTKTGSIFVDDSYNATPKSFESAVGYISKLKGEKIVLTPGVIELGKRSREIHLRLGNLMKGKIDKLVITSKEPYGPFSESFGNKNLILETDSKRLLNVIASALNNPKGVLLLEGRQSKMVTEFIQKLK